MSTEIPFIITTAQSTSDNGTLPWQGEISMTRLTVLGTTTVLSALTGAYILIALLIYEWRVRDPKIKPSSRRPAKERYAAMMRISTIAAALLGTLAFVSQVFQIYLDFVQDIRFCDALIKIDFTLISCIFISVYALLWLRQRSFYVNASTRHLTSCYTRVLSTMTLVLLFLISFINPTVFDSTQWYARTRFGCKLQSSAFPTEYHWGALAVIATGFQLILLALFVYPLVKHRAALKLRTQKSKKMNSKVEGFVKVIRRAFYLALVCVISDIIVVIVNVGVVTEINVIPQIVADANILLNTTCSIATFVDWRERLFPCLEIGSTSSSSRKETTSRGETTSREKTHSAERSSSETAMDDKVNSNMEKGLVV